jgi:hypothetical protein
MVSVCGLWLDVDCIETAGEGITALLGSKCGPVADQAGRQSFSATI